MPRTSPPRKDKNRVPREKREIPAAPKKDAERVAKVIARAGLGSRREIEDWIAEGRIAVNGEVLASPAVTVTAADAITVDGAPLPERERTRLFLYHKPKGVVTTNRDPEGRTTLFEILPRGLPRLVSVGRLDLNSEGLLLLTNDGGLARALELPETGWLRRYRVRANGAIDQAQLDTLLDGTTVDGVEYGPIEAVLDRTQGANSWITVSLREGKNREVRNVLAALGLTVNRLIRVSYGPFQLGEIAEGAAEEVRTRVLRDQIGAEIAEAAGVDFAGPISDLDIEEAPSRPLRPAGKRQAKADAQGGAKGRAARDFRPESRGGRSYAEERGAPPPRGPRGRRPVEEREFESLGTVSDRKGRTVKVERLVGAPADAERPARAGAKRPGPGRGTDAPRGKRPRAGGPRGYGQDGDARRGPRRFADEDGAGQGPSRRPRFEAGSGDRRPPRRTEDWEQEGRPPRGEGRAERPPRRFAGEDGVGQGPSRRPRFEAGSGDRRPPRRTEDWGQEGRPPRGEGRAERPARRFAGEDGAGQGPSRRPRSDSGGEGRPPRRADDRGEFRAPRAAHKADRPARGFDDRGPGRRSFGRDGDFAGEGRPARRTGGYGGGGASAGGRPQRRSEGPGEGYAGPRAFRGPRSDEGGRPSGGRGGFGGKSPRRDDGDAGGGAGYGRADGGPRGKAGTGGKSFGNKSFGGKGPGSKGPGSKGGGRPGSYSPGGRSPGGRPTGGKPSGPRGKR